MATQTFQHSSFGNGQVVVEIDVNDATWLLSRVRCINNSAHALAARVLSGGTEVWTGTAPAGQTTQWNVAGVQLGWDSVNSGIVMGNYVVQVRWLA